MPNARRRGTRGTTIAHVGLAVRANEALRPLLRDILGLAEASLDDSDGARIAGYAVGDALIELLEPAVDGTPIAKFIDKRGPGIHHLCLAVDDLDDTLARCRVAGITPIDPEPRRGAEGKRVAFLHPKTTGGVLIELSEY